MPSITIGCGVGDIVHSLLTEAQFQAERGTSWILLSSYSLTGTRLNAITGFTTLPDGRSMVLKGKMNGRADAFADPDGETALGTQQADRNKYHDHNYSDPGHDHVVGLWNGGFTGGNYQHNATGSDLTNHSTNTNTTGITFNADGSMGEDSRSNSLIVNIFCKIN